MSDVNTAAEQQSSPIGALYPYIQHRKPECSASCVCGAREAVLAVERELGAADDEVNHPRHYNSHPANIECIDVIEEFGFNIGNAIKYLWRAGLKPGTNAPTDLRKAAWYVHREIERLSKRARPKGEPASRGAPVDPADEAVLWHLDQQESES